MGGPDDPEAIADAAAQAVPDPGKKLTEMLEAVRRQQAESLKLLHGICQQEIEPIPLPPAPQLTPPSLDPLAESQDLLNAHTRFLQETLDKLTEQMRQGRP